VGLAEFAAGDAAIDKARLITKALDALREAEQLDERESLDRASWDAWYDATIPQVHEIKILAGAMAIELHRRRGEEQQWRRPGRPSTQMVTQCGTISAHGNAQLSRDRALAAQPLRVAKYIQDEAAAGRVPSVRGALREIKKAKPLVEPNAKPNRTKAPQDRPLSRGHMAARTRITRAHQRLFDRIAQVSGAPLTAGDLGVRLGLKGAETGRFLHDAGLLPWVRIDRSGNVYTIAVNEDLRELCALHGSRPDLPGGSVAAFLGNLRREILRRREENKDNRLKRRWTAEGISQVEQSALLDWIEKQLDVVSEARIPGRKDKSSA